MYPGTAEEYAKQLNKQAGRHVVLTDPDTWAERGVHTGEQLAHMLAVGHHYDLHDIVHNKTSPYSNADYDAMGIEQLEQEIEELKKIRQRHGQ